MLFRSVIAYTLSTVHHYEKSIITSDSNSLEENKITFIIDESTYNTLQEEDFSRTSGGVTYQKKVRKNAVSIYDYEVKQNEDKRSINLLKKEYAYEAENQFQNLMA